MAISPVLGKLTHIYVLNVLCPTQNYHVICHSQNLDMQFFIPVPKIWEFVQGKVEKRKKHIHPCKKLNKSFFLPHDTKCIAFCCNFQGNHVCFQFTFLQYLSVYSFRIVITCEQNSGSEFGLCVQYTISIEALASFDAKLGKGF